MHSSDSNDALINSQGYIASGDDPLERGEYQLIFKLLRVLDNGSKAKEEVDMLLDHYCNIMQNLRTAVYNLKVQSLECSQSRKVRLEHVASNYLIRYFYLITFSAYLSSASEVFSFTEWLDDRPEITGLLETVSLD